MLKILNYSKNLVRSPILFLQKRFTLMSKEPIGRQLKDRHKEGREQGKVDVKE